ncbi:MAG: R3H domain-containing nucleic acid-binding protein [Candidatus Nanopelagicales bacterium]
MTDVLTPTDDDAEVTAGESSAPTRDLVAEGDAAADYLEGLLDIVDLDGDIDIDVEGDRAQVAIIEVNKGELGSLVGVDGKVMDALQDLARLAATQSTGHRSRLMLDIAGVRAERREGLREIATAAVTEVTKSGEPMRLAPMNAFERKVIHDVVTEAGLVSESEGVEPQRRIVVRPA